MDNCNCSCHIIPLNNQNQNCFYHTQCVIDSKINNLKTDIFEKEKSKDYCLLESKLRQLQNDIQLLSQEKLRIEYKLRQTETEKYLSLIHI